MTHSLTYTGLSPSALLAAAKYDPPSADLVKALSDAVSEALSEWEEEIKNLVAEIDTLHQENAEFEDENLGLKNELLKSNGDYE